jgi:hypothetical protein
MFVSCVGIVQNKRETVRQYLLRGSASKRISSEEWSSPPTEVAGHKCKALYDDELVVVEEEEDKTRRDHHMENPYDDLEEDAHSSIEAVDIALVERHAAAVVHCPNILRTVVADADVDVDADVAVVAVPRNNILGSVVLQEDRGRLGLGKKKANHVDYQNFHVQPRQEGYSREEEDNPNGEAYALVDNTMVDFPCTVHAAVPNTTALSAVAVRVEKRCWV